MTLSFPYWITRGDPVLGTEDTIETEVTVTATWDSMDDSGYREGWYIEDITACVNGESIELTDREVEEVTDIAAERAQQQTEPQSWDYLY